jgi:hypothetical protein
MMDKAEQKQAYQQLLSGKISLTAARYLEKSLDNDPLYYGSIDDWEQVRKIVHHFIGSQEYKAELAEKRKEKQEKIDSIVNKAIAVQKTWTKRGAIHNWGRKSLYDDYIDNYEFNGTIFWREGLWGNNPQEFYERIVKADNKFKKLKAGGDAS